MIVTRDFYFSCTHALPSTILLNGCYIRVKKKKKYLTLSKAEISIGRREMAGRIVLSKLDRDGKFEKNANASSSYRIVKGAARNSPPAFLSSGLKSGRSFRPKISHVHLQYLISLRTVSKEPPDDT